jgi:hypothetical protein
LLLKKKYNDIEWKGKATKNKEKRYIKRMF